MSPIAIRATVGAGLALALMSCATHRPEPVHIGQQDVRSPRPKVERPTPATIEPQTGTGLETLVRLDIPTGLPNVEAGALYVLRGSGYTFASYCAHCPAKAGLIAKEPISPLAYTGGITTVRRALLLIAGSHSKLVVDDRAKVVTFDEYTGS